MVVVAIVVVVALAVVVVVVIVDPSQLLRTHPSLVATPCFVPED